jgi:hypothetical protein
MKVRNSTETFAHFYRDTRRHIQNVSNTKIAVMSSHLRELLLIIYPPTANFSLFRAIARSKPVLMEEWLYCKSLNIAELLRYCRHIEEKC